MDLLGSIKIQQLWLNDNFDQGSSTIVYSAIFNKQSFGVAYNKQSFGYRVGISGMNLVSCS